MLVALSKKRSVLSRELLDLQEQLKLKQSEIDTLDCSMLLLGVSCDMELARPRRVYTRTFDYGELKRLIIETLKAADGPMTTRQVTDEIRRRKRLLQDCKNPVSKALWKYRVTVKVGETDSGESLWTLKSYATKPKPSAPRLRLV